MRNVYTNFQIEYIVISDGSPLTSVYLPPDIFTNQIIDYLKCLPKNILQLVDATNYYEFQLRSSLNQGYDLKVVNVNDWNIFKNVINNINSIRIFFIDGESNRQHEILNELLIEDNHLSYYSYYKKIGKIKHENILNSPFEILWKIIADQSEIINKLGLKDKLFDLSVPIEFSRLIGSNYFLPIRNNIYTINNSIGNFFFSNFDEDVDDVKRKHSEMSTVAFKNKDTFNRQELFNKQLNDIDALIKIAYGEKLITKVSGIEPGFPPIVLIAPFHNPDFKTENKELEYSLTLEQTSNYTIEGDPSKTPFDLAIMGIKYHKLRLKYLDDLSYLHSSFCFSPTLRLPIKGKSVYRELSFFGPKSFPNISKPKARRKLLKSITSFGEKYTNSTINQATQKIIKLRDSQIVAISDLPIEWLIIEDIPLSFTHDICRIPESSLHGIMAHYISCENFKFSISREIIKNVLVIIGSVDKDFKKWHEELYRLQRIHKFNVEICEKIDDVNVAVRKYKPHLLIFDCHGGFDSETNSTYLIIGDDKLNASKVIENNITAPLVFLSACGTAPTYGTMNPIANAFFEIGALSVTSTFLPISVDGGSILYLRLISKLNYAANNVIHKNWLEFISHIIRTSTINDAYLAALSKNKEINISEFQESNVTTLTDSLQFVKRRGLYKSIDKKISQIAKNNQEYYSSIIPEYLLYTNLGRSDLILFDTWNNENHKVNVI